MKLYKKLLFAAFAAVGLSLASCSDKGDEPNGGDDGDYEIDYYATSVLQRPWKITEHEYSGKSYYTKDFETSWVINQAFRANGRVYTPFSYKLSLQSEVHYIEEVEVRDYPDEPELVICDSNTGQRIFTLEEYYDGGNYYVMIIRDRQGNRFRCESRDNAKMYFATNVSSYETLSLAYKATVSSTGVSKEIDYTVETLPRNVFGAYTILLEGDVDAVEFEVKTPGGASKVQTSSGFALGFNNGDITDEGFVVSGDEPGPKPSGEYDTEAEDILNGVFVSQGGFGNKFLINVEMPGIGRPLSVCPGTSKVEYIPEVRVRNCEDGTRWIVLKNNPEERKYRLVDYASDGSTITIAVPDSPDTPIVLDRQTDCLVHFYKNETSYKNVHVHLRQIAVGGINTDTTHWWYIPLSQGEDGVAAMPIKWYDQSKPLTIESELFVVNPDDFDNGIEFEYTSTVEPGSSMIVHTTITDADIPYKSTEEEIAALEAKMWPDGSATAWKIYESCKDGESYVAHEPYGWIITERVKHYTGTHFADYVNKNEEDGDGYLYNYRGKLYLSTSSTEKPFQILTPVPEILETGEMEVLHIPTKIKYKCRMCKKPLIGYYENDFHYWANVKLYQVLGYNASGRLVYDEKVRGFFEGVGSGKYGAFALLADEEISKATGAVKFTIARDTYYVDYGGNSEPFKCVFDAVLGSIVNVDKK